MGFIGVESRLACTIICQKKFIHKDNLICFKLLDLEVFKLNALSDCGKKLFCCTNLLYVTWFGAIKSGHFLLE